MQSNKPWYRWEEDILVLDTRVQPRAKKDQLIGPEGGHLKVRIVAPPVAGKANDYLRRYLAKEFGVSKSRVEIVSGAQTHLKRLRIQSPRKLPAYIDPH